MLKKDRKSDLNLQISLLNITWRIVAPLLIFVTFGFVLDSIFKTKPFFIISAVVVSAAVTFTSIFLTVKKGAR